MPSSIRNLAKISDSNHFEEAMTATSRIPSAECRNNRNFTLHEKLSTQFPRRTYACFCENKTKQSLIKQILKKLKQNLPLPTNMSNRYMIVNEYFQYGKN